MNKTHATKLWKAVIDYADEREELGYAEGSESIFDTDEYIECTDKQLRKLVSIFSSLTGWKPSNESCSWKWEIEKYE